MIGSALGGVLVDKLVDAYVTPAGLIALMSGARIESGRISKLDGQADENQPFSNPSLSYESLNKFSVGVVSSEAEEEVKFILRRGRNRLETDRNRASRIDRKAAELFLRDGGSRPG